ncbi:hypothetical protein ACSBR1_029247 [Camellia fascicularis]
MASDEVPIPDPTVGIGVALGVDMEIEEAAAALLSFAERPFDAATYQPRTHVPPPSSILRFGGFIVRLDEDTLLREPMEHVSTDASMVIARRIGGYSSISGPDVGTSDFLLSPILFYPDMPQWRDAQLQLLGAIPDTASHGMVRYNWFLEHFFGTQPATAGEVAQYAHGFLIYLLGTTLFANRENTVGLYILRALVHLPQVVEYDWGGTGLATLYCYMSSVSRCKADSLGSYWRVWEVYPHTNFSDMLYILLAVAFLAHLIHFLMSSIRLLFAALGLHIFHFPGSNSSEADRVVSTPLLVLQLTVRAASLCRSYLPILSPLL